MKKLTLIRESRRPRNIRVLLEKSSFADTLEGVSSVLIKVNLIGFREKYGMTSPEAAAELVKFIKEIKKDTNIIIAEASQTAYSEGKSTEEVFKRQKFALAKREGAELFPLEKGEYEEIEIETVEGRRKIRVSKLRADLIISFTPPKTHPVLVVSAAIDNIAFGMTHPEDRHLLYGGKLWPENPLPFYKYAARNVVKVVKHIGPHVGIIDGLFGMEGRGPISGTPVFHQFATASRDFVLLDSLTAALTGTEPEKIEYLKIAEDRGLGHMDYKKFIPADRIKQIRFPYRLHPASMKLV